MFSNFKLSVILFFPLLLAICDGFALETCYKPFPKFADPSQLDAKAIIDDINEFYKHFNERYSELEMFIKRYMWQSNELDVKFHLYTQENHIKPQVLHPDSLIQSNFNRKSRTIVLVDGLLPLKNFSDGPMASLKHALLLRGVYNVIVMDYSTYANMPYTKALKYSFLVAKNAADFLMKLMKTFKLSAKDLHLIGFGFGGQVAANIGYPIPGLGRISALDPAGALFDLFPAKYRLSPDDANFVDVIHTSTGKFPEGFGFPRQVGDIDFFPNGGKNQPGCKHDITAKMAGSKAAADLKNALCDHKRAMELYIETVCDRVCSFTGTRCESYKEYRNWRCLYFNSERETMGFYAQKNNKVGELARFYMYTNSYYPYCKLLWFC